MIPRLAIVALLAVAGAGCWTVRTQALPVSGSNPRFDWFEYQGNDSVYRTLAQGPDTYVNPILAGFYPDPSITRVGDDYYIVNSSFAYFPGVPIFHSRDLVSWRQIGHVLTRRSQLDLDSAGISRGIFAPTISHHDGRFYMIVTLVDRGGNFYVTATDPAGPWSDPVWLPSVDGIDPSFFFDDNGKAYVLNNGPPIETPRYSGHRAIWIQEFDIASGRMVGKRSLIVNGGVDITKNPIWIEGPHIIKKDGFYYLTCAEGGTSTQHSQVVLRSTSPDGPYTPHKDNPILTQRHLGPRPFPVTSAGHADLVETPNGEWWAIFLATRPYRDDMYNTGRETFMLPVKWVDGWPSILTGTDAIPYLVRRPALPRQPAATIPLNGNFTHRDEFTEPVLPMHWQTIRVPGDAFVDLATAPGSLTLKAKSDGFEPTARPAFVGRRQQHLDATATVAMTFVPERNGDKAGLVAFQNDLFYYFAAVTRVNGETRIQLEKHAGRGTSSIVASLPITVSPARPVHLRVTARGALYDFHYATAPGEWKTLATDVDGTILSTRVAQGFVGTMLGMYALRAPAVQ